MGEIIKKNFDSPDESREPTDNVKVALVDWPIPLKAFL